MKRNIYVDNQGNPIDYKFESKKNILNVLLFLNILLPLVLLIMTIVTIVNNNSCIKIYNKIETATRDYLKDNDRFPLVEGDSVQIAVSKLYDGYLSSYYTNDMECSGNVKVTNYKGKYVYTLNVAGCDKCSVDIHYKGWSNELSYYPNKTIIDVVPYYNYHEREVNVTKWSDYFEPDKLEKKKSKYGFALPIEKDRIPEVPEGSKVYKIEKEDLTEYSYSDKKWLWYDIKGDYSDFSSETPDGYAHKDENAYRYTDWTDYSLDAPLEKDYRSIQTSTGYIFYYEKNGKKIYANHKQYMTNEQVDSEKYDKHETQTAMMYRYRDKQWRFYNGQKRHYSTYSSAPFRDTKIRDDESMIRTEYNSWTRESSINEANKSYRTEKTRTVSRFRYLYEILSDSVYIKPVNRKAFISDVGMSPSDFVLQDNYKMDVTYKFRYRKR